MKLDQQTKMVWDKAKKCNCKSKQQDEADAHKLCGICKKTMIYGAYESVKNQQNSIYRWNLDHKKPKSQGGDNSIENLQAVHVKCNRKKGSS
ncbi:HNH endonuclease [Spiroplasma phoeniceum]|uniref:HNH nuclease domain-containing protein n=1 Tax=Spiroplasma phoeniceum P40 TaxID=1276259 RepID=A0A345DM27_9MOLU|nr:HNH endonuclease signature motif containing protein [Spiroplasma phoeniceum]AXF95265.1 hypothetical protein SDAV_00270 [Spiroplasma phoeniceum P40]